MTEYTRRQVLRTAGAAAGTAVVAGTLSNPITADAADEPVGSDTNPLKLWYTRPATEWLQALAVTRSGPAAHTSTTIRSAARCCRRSGG